MNKPRTPVTFVMGCIGLFFDGIYLLKQYQNRERRSSGSPTASVFSIV
jgi:hypothetical protein